MRWFRLSWCLCGCERGPKWHRSIVALRGLVPAAKKSFRKSAASIQFSQNFWLALNLLCAFSVSFDKKKGGAMVVKRPLMRKCVVLLFCVSLIGPAFIGLTAKSVHAGKKGDVAEQIGTDLLAGGVSLAAAMTGNIPLAFAAGFLTKYISTYGVKGIKALIEFFKGYQPQDLGEINLYYVYLLHVKRNLYQSMITIRKSVEADGGLSNLEGELKRVEEVLKGECNIDQGCTPVGLDDNLVNFQFINIILDAKQSVDVSRFLSVYEIKNTYQYLLLLYLDVIVVEQKLVEAQYNMMASRTLKTIKILKDNKYISNAEKEFQTQLLMNMALRWMYLADTRRVVVASAMRGPADILQKENDELQREIDKYRKHNKRRSGLQ